MHIERESHTLLINNRDFFLTATNLPDYFLKRAKYKRLIRDHDGCRRAAAYAASSSTAAGLSWYT